MRMTPMSKPVVEAWRRSYVNRLSNNYLDRGVYNDFAWRDADELRPETAGVRPLRPALVFQTHGGAVGVLILAHERGSMQALPPVLRGYWGDLSGNEPFPASADPLNMTIDFDARLERIAA